MEAFSSLPTADVYSQAMNNAQQGWTTPFKNKTKKSNKPIGRDAWLTHLKRKSSATQSCYIGIIKSFEDWFNTKHRNEELDQDHFSDFIAEKELRGEGTATTIAALKFRYVKV